MHFQTCTGKDLFIVRQSDEFYIRAYAIPGGKTVIYTRDRRYDNKQCEKDKGRSDKHKGCFIEFSFFCIAFPSFLKRIP